MPQVFDLAGFRLQRTAAGDFTESVPDERFNQRRLKYSPASLGLYSGIQLRIRGYRFWFHGAILPQLARPEYTPNQRISYFITPSSMA